MNNKTEEGVLIKIIRWIFFLPVGIFLYYLSKIISNLFIWFVDGDLVYELSQSQNTFAGHYVTGPIYVFIISLTSTFAFLYGSGLVLGITKMKMRKYAFIVPSVLMLIYLVGYIILILVSLTEIKFNLEWLAYHLCKIAAGFLCVFYYLKQIKEFERISKPSIFS